MDLNIQGMELTDLPNEILMKILSLLSTGDLLRNVALVSKRFYDITKEAPVHIHVKVDQECDQDGAVMFLRRARFLRSFTISAKRFVVRKQETGEFFQDQRSVSCDRLFLSLIQLEHVESISVLGEFMEINSATFIRLGAATWWKKLKKLHLESFGIEDYEVVFASLVSLNHFAADCIVSLMTILQKSPNLAYFKSRWQKAFSRDSLMELTRIGAQQVQRLDLFGCDDTITPEVYAGLVNFENLENLGLGPKFFNWSILAYLPKLTTLKIMNSQELDLIYLRQSIQSGSLSTVINLAVHHFDSVGNLALSDEDAQFSTSFNATLAYACPNLKWLKVSSLASSKQLTPFFETCPELQVLIFEGNPNQDSKHHDQDYEVLLDLICAPLSKVEYLEATKLDISEEQAQNMLFKSNLKGLLTWGVLSVKDSMTLDQLDSLLEKVRPSGIDVEDIRRLSKPD